MFIIFGWRGVTTTPNRGHFVCPQCLAEAPFRHRRVRNFFTLFFIPVIPLNMVGEYVECEHCGGTFQTLVLDARNQVTLRQDAANRQRFEIEFKGALLELMLSVAVVDQNTGPAQIQAVKAAYRQMLGQDLPHEIFEGELARHLGSRVDITERMQHVAELLSDQGKADLIKAAYSVASAGGGQPSARQKAILDKATEILSAGSLRRLHNSLLAGDGPPLALKPDAVEILPAPADTGQTAAPGSPLSDLQRALDHPRPRQGNSQG